MADANVLLLVGAVLWIASYFLRRRYTVVHDATQRRIGWGYGYGAGWVDGKHDLYDSTAPADGRTRKVASDG